MRRLLTFAAFFLCIAIVPAYAQRGGGHGASGGGHGGFSGGGGHIGGGFSGGGFTGGHIGGLGSHFVGHGPVGTGSHFSSHYGSPMGSGRYYAHNGRYGGGRYGDHHRFRNRFGYPYYGYGYGCSGYGYGCSSYLPGIDPYWWWDTYPSDDADQRQMANEMNEENLEEQQALREQDQDAYAEARPWARPAEPAVSAQTEKQPATLLVYRDQHQREIQNYAITDDMIYIFTAQRTERVPLSVIDVPATIRANQDRGVDFQLPGVREGE